MLTSRVDTSAIGSVLALCAVLAGCGGLAADGTSDLGPAPEPSAHRLDQMLAALLDDAQALPAGDRRFARYFLLTPSASDPELLGEDVGPDDPEWSERTYWRARVGASKVANSLSNEPIITVPRAIDAAELLLRIDLRDYGWDEPVTVGGAAYPDAWEAIVAAARLAPEIEGPHADRLKAVTGSSRSFLFANDFITTASDGETYYGVLGVPDSLGTLEGRLTGGTLGAPRAELERQRMYRAGFDTSGASTAPRAVERRFVSSDPSLGYWQAFDFEDDGRGEEIFSEPLGFVPDGKEVIFTLPNGLFGFYMTDRAGTRVTVSTVRSVVNPAVPDWVLRSANACFSCHAGGVIVFEDQVRALVEAEPWRSGTSGPEAVFSVYPEQRVMNRFIDEANRPLVRAHVQTGQDEGMPDPVSRVHIDELYQPLRSDIAAAQLFVDSAQLPANLPDTALEPETYRAGYTATLCALTRQAQNHPRDCR